MPIQILMPALSPTMTEGNLAKWHKKAGDAVKAGDVIAEIETDKATMEVEAVDEGVIGKILVEEGTQAVAVNSPIAILLEEGESESSIAQVAAKPQDGPAPTVTDKSAPPEKQPSAQPQATAQTAQQSLDRPGEATGAHATPGSEGERIFASPLARRIAEQNGVDLHGISGSGPNGRIVKADVEGAPRGQSAPSGRASAAAPQSNINAAQLADQLGQKYTAVPNSNVRKVIARRLLESKQTVPHFYLSVECRIDKLLKLRAELNEGADSKVSVNDLVIKAAAAALKIVPAANASWTDDAIMLYDSVDISVAVATPNGLITPIVKAADTKGVRQVSREMKDLAARARDNKLRPEEFQGGGFSISNLGMFGISHFSAIINPPQACILAIGAGEKKPVVEGDNIVVGTVMTATLSVDHRAVDGAVGAEYLQAFKKLLESPLSILA